MKKTEQSVKKVNIFNQGADSDTNEKILGATSTQKYIDARNMAVRGRNDKVLKFTGGERLVHGISDDQWECIWTNTVNGHLVEFWVNQIGTITQIIIDGTLMGETDKLNFDAAHPLQGDTNDRCDGGEAYVTDGKIPNPIYIFNIQDIIDCYNGLSTGVDTYFANFNPTLYQAVLKTSPHHPVFVQLEVRYGAGLLVGKYNYSIRYSDSTGNKTSWSVQTPNIPIPMAVGLGSLNHPGIKTFGGAQSMMSSSGIRLRFRVDNPGGYEYIEIRRVAHVDSQGINYIPTPEYIKLITDADGATVDILNSPQQVIDWIDDANLNNEWLELSDEEDTLALSGSFTAKSLRYYQNRLVAMNINYPSKDVEPYIENLFVMKNKKLGFPVIEKLTDLVDRQGFQKVENQVNYPTQPTGERDGWGVYFMDDFGARSFVVPFDDLAGHDLKNFQMPNRRESISAETQEYSVTKWKGACVASTINSNDGIDVGYVHEVFDMEDGRKKTDYCSFHNILNHGSKIAGKVNDNEPFNNCDPATITNTASTGFTNQVLGSTLGYLPFSPAGDNDSVVSGHNARVNLKVGRIYEGNNGGEVEGIVIDYDPPGFAPNYYSLGMGFWGLQNIPEWARAFSIVKTKPAGRLVCQGVGFWKFKKDLVGSVSKETNRLLFYSPDMDSNLSGQISMSDIVANPGAYRIQLVSPLGAFSEVYDGEQTDLTIIYPSAGDVDWVGADRAVDMAVYIRQQREQCNPSYPSATVGYGNGGHISYGRWLNSLASGEAQAAVWDTNNGDRFFEISAANVLVDGRSTMLDVTLDIPIYANGGVNNNNFVALDPSFWAEPFYIINIVKEGANVPYGNINTYLETGNIQKIDSRIGVSNGTNNQSFILVDERWEDCIPNYLNPNVSDENRYVFVDGRRWINVTYKSAAVRTAILNQMTNTGSYFDTDGNECVGVYQNVNSPGLSAGPYYILFNQFDNSFNSSLFVPLQDANVSVRYDNRIPIKVFAGDAVVAENTFVPYDKRYDSNADSVDGLQLCTGIPYQRYDINDRVYLIKRSQGLGDNIQDNNEIYPKQFRQILVDFICESRVNVPYLYGSRYPHVHYVMRPHRWKQGSENDVATFLGENNMVFAGLTPYYDNYGFEWNDWQYGGFRTGGSTNIDYQKVLNDRVNTNKPQLGFKEKTRFCTRVIYSNKRSINEQDDPNLRSFPNLNVFDVSDAYGEIKYAYDNDSSKGNNLFAVTEHGVCLLITDKKILSDFSGTEIANMKTDSGFIQGEYWLSKEIGSSGEMWRGIGEYNNQMFLPNTNGVYLLNGLSLVDILRGGVSTGEGQGMAGYRTRLLPYLRGVLPGCATPMCATYDQENNEFLLHIGSVHIPVAIISDSDYDRLTISSPQTFIFSNDPGKGFWSGYADYDFERMTYLSKYNNVSEGRVFGMRNHQAYRLGVGTTINGAPAVKQVIYPVCPMINQTMELIDGTINSSAKPTSIEFAHTLGSLHECQVLAPIIRDYTNAYYFMVPRKSKLPNDRLQNDCFVIRVTHDIAADFNIISIETGLKPIKW